MVGFTLKKSPPPHEPAFGAEMTVTVTEGCCNRGMLSQKDAVTGGCCHRGMLSKRAAVTGGCCHRRMLSQRFAVTDCCSQNHIGMLSQSYCHLKKPSKLMASGFLAKQNLLQVAKNPLPVFC